MPPYDTTTLIPHLQSRYALFSGEDVFVDGKGCRPILSLHLRNDEFAVIGTQDGCRFAHTGCADVLGDRRAETGFTLFITLIFLSLSTYFL